MERHSKNASFDFDGSPDKLPLSMEPSPFTLRSPEEGAYKDDVESAGGSGPSRRGSQSHSTPSARYAKGGPRQDSGPGARLIVHTDIEEMPRENEEDLIELPPQYSASRKPMSSLVGSEAGISESSGSGGASFSEVQQARTRPRKN
jgi:hypothetical protein